MFIFKIWIYLYSKLLVKYLPQLAFAWINVLSVHSTYHKLIYRTVYLSNSYESVLLWFSSLSVFLVFATKIVMKKFHGKTMMVHNLFSESRLQTLILSSVVYGSVYRLLPWTLNLESNLNEFKILFVFTQQQRYHLQFLSVL